MSDSWYYLHQGTTYGPATRATLGTLASQGQLAPTDLVWPEGDTAILGVPASKVVSFPPEAHQPAVPDWLDDVAREQAPRAGCAASLDWVDDLRRMQSTGPSQAAASAQPGHQPTLVQPTPASAGQGLLNIGSATSRGMVRERNEDSFLVLHGSWANLDARHEIAIVVVADGMGGYQGGDRASGLAIRAMAKALAPLLVESVAASPTAGSDVVAAAIDRALQEAHQAVTAAAKNEAGHKDMGATAVVVVIQDETAHIGLLGDCRVYHQHENHFDQITRDQTLVNRMVELGQLTPQEAASHPRRNEVTQGLGMRAAIQAAAYRTRLQPGDWLVVACDGLYTHVEDMQLREEIRQWRGSADRLAEHLVEVTNGLGGSDNCTVAVIRFQGIHGGPS
jgi:protein phosphatase